MPAQQFFLTKSNAEFNENLTNGVVADTMSLATGEGLHIPHTAFLFYM